MDTPHLQDTTKNSDPTEKEIVENNEIEKNDKVLDNDQTDKDSNIDEDFIDFDDFTLGLEGLYENIIYKTFLRDTENYEAQEFLSNVAENADNYSKSSNLEGIGVKMEEDEIIRHLEEALGTLCTDECDVTENDNDESLSKIQINDSTDGNVLEDMSEEEINRIQNKSSRDSVQKNRSVFEETSCKITDTTPKTKDELDFDNIDNSGQNQCGNTSIMEINHPENSVTKNISEVDQNTAQNYNLQENKSHNVEIEDNSTRIELDPDNINNNIPDNEPKDKQNVNKKVSTKNAEALDKMTKDEQNSLEGDKKENIYENVYQDVTNGPGHRGLCENFQASNIVYKFVGAAFRSFRDRPKKTGWQRRSFGNWDVEMKPEAELSRSQYSLVSCNDLTAGAVQLWLGLPEEVKYDPALAPFRQFYEKEQGKLENKRNGSSTRRQRLPSVNSAPHLNNNHVREAPLGSADKQPDKMEKLIDDHGTIIPEKSMVQKAQHYTKMTLLLACWIFFTAAFLMYNEKEIVIKNSFVLPSEVKNYVLSTQGDFSVLLHLSGPVLSETSQLKMNASDAAAAKKMEVWVERLETKGEIEEVVQSSETWQLILQDETTLDFSEGETRSTTLKLKPHAIPGGTGSNFTNTFALRIRTTANYTTPFAISYTVNPLDVHTGVIYACVLLFSLYVLIIFEIINRTMAAVLVSTSALATLSILGQRPSLPEIISWLDMETLLLLFSMMLLVAIMAETGMFDYLAVFAFQVTKGKLWPLISLLCAITALLSTFLDNVTTVLLMTPVTIRLCEVMDLDPIPILMSMVLFSNIGGTATPVGDPPNVIIASNKAVVQAGINFTNFTMHMTLGILLVCVQTAFQLRFIYRDTNKLRLNEPRDIKDLRHQISIWRRAAESLPHMSRDEHVVRERLERKVKKLTVQLESMVRESNKRAIPKDCFGSTLAEMKDKYKIRDKGLLIKSTVAIGFVVTVFFLHSIPELNRVSLGWTALLGAILLLTLADREDLEPILHRVEWSTLLFFAALFVLMEALAKLGLIEYIGGLTVSLILSVDENARLAVAILLMLWVSGVTSAFVDNIPLTTMMVRIVTSLGSNPTLNLPMAPLIWALSFGACLGGNGTLIGASANVVCAGVAEQHGYRFTFMQFFKIGFPVMLGHLVIASGYLMFCHCLFTWH